MAVTAAVLEGLALLDDTASESDPEVLAVPSAMAELPVPDQTASGMDICCGCVPTRGSYSTPQSSAASGVVPPYLEWLGYPRKC
jgi:hypothetical protein